MDIVEMIENNPIRSLSETYQHTLVERIKSRFSQEEQSMFITSMYGFLNYSRTDFVIDLDEIWKWCGFSLKLNAKRVLEKNFVIDKDYKCLLCKLEKQKGRGGQNKEQILMTINTFKRFCMKAGTKKAEQIHEYYINLEETLQEVINEECSQLREQIENQTQQIQTNEQEKKRLREKTLLKNFPPNTQCIYYGIIDNKTTENERVVKFGNSNYLQNRVETHKKTFDNFFLLNAFKVENKVQIETAMKNDPLLKTLRRTIRIQGTPQTELLCIDNHTYEQIDKQIEDIIQSVEYNPENYNKLLQENAKIKREYTILLDKYNKLAKHTDEEPLPFTQSSIPTPHVRKFQKDKNGNYLIDDIVYNKLNGSREEVWNQIAYKTSGGLVKKELVKKPSGKIVSKTKHIDSKKSSHLNTPKS
jgi:phage anti-repressor protein